VKASCVCVTADLSRALQLSVHPSDLVPGVAGWGTEQATARITSVAKGAAKPNVQLGRDRDGTGSLASVAPARPMDG